MSVEAARMLGAAIAEASGDREGTGALRAVAVACRAFALAHPGLYESMLPVPQAGVDEEGYAAFAEPALVLARVMSGPPLVCARRLRGPGGAPHHWLQLTFN